MPVGMLMSPPRPLRRDQRDRTDDDRDVAVPRRCVITAALLGRSSV